MIPKREKRRPMLNHNPDLNTLVATKTLQLAVPRPRAAWPEGRLVSRQYPAPINPAIFSWHCRTQPEGTQVIIRFRNGYGAIISEYPRAAGTYEVAPLRFHGPDPDDYEFHFRSHVPDLTWCCEIAEIEGVCDQISRLLPPDGV
jgi:hypothetical protein